MYKPLYSQHLRLSHSVARTCAGEKRGQALVSEGGLGLAQALAGAHLFATHSLDLLFLCAQIRMDKSFVDVKSEWSCLNRLLNKVLRPGLNGRYLSTCLGGLHARKSVSDHDRDVPVLARHISEGYSRDKIGLPSSGFSHCSIAADPTGSWRYTVDRIETIYVPLCSPCLPRHHRQTYRTSNTLHNPAPCPLHASHGLPWPIGVFTRREALRGCAGHSVVPVRKRPSEGRCW